MKRNMDYFVLITLLISTVVDLGVVFSGSFVKNTTILYMWEFLIQLGYLVTFIRFLRDSDYKFLYYLGAILMTAGIEEGLYYIKNMYFPLYNIYVNTIVEGIIGAFSFAYFYQTFKRMSYDHVKEFKIKHKLDYDKDKLEI